MASVTRRILLPLGIIVLLIALHPVWLGWVGEYLVHADPPAHADIAVVLAGDWWGNRILKAGELVKQGYVPRALVDGPAGFYGFSESDLAIAFAVKQGYPGQWFVPFPMHANSTDEEARLVVSELRRLGVHKFLLVTSNYHTRRAGRLFRKVAPDLDMRVVAASDQAFRPGDWWHTRAGRKQAFFEWTKTMAEWMGL